MAISLSTVSRAPFQNLRESPFLDIDALDAIFKQLPKLNLYLTRSLESQGRAWHVIYTPTYLGVEKILESKGIQGGMEIRLESIVTRLEKEPLGAFVTDRGVLLGLDQEQHAVGLSFQKIHGNLVIFIFDAHSLGSCEVFYKDFQHNLEARLSCKVYVIQNKESYINAVAQKNVCSALSIAFVEAFLHHPNFFGEMLSANEVSYDDIPACHALKALPRDMECFNVDMSLARHALQVKDLVDLFEIESLRSTSGVTALVTKMFGFILKDMRKKND